MNSYVDDALVGLLLLLSASYAFSALGPAAWRRRVLAASSAWLARAPAALGLHRAAQRLAQAAQAKPPGACGGCDNCGAEEPASNAAAADAATEIRVPISRIERVRR